MTFAAMPPLRRSDRSGQGGSAGLLQLLTVARACPPAGPGGSLGGVSADGIRSAFEALGEGDVEPLVALIDPAMEWRGRRRLPRFWRPAPS